MAIYGRHRKKHRRRGYTGGAYAGGYLVGGDMDEPEPGMEVEVIEKRRHKKKARKDKKRNVKHKRRTSAWGSFLRRHLKGKPFGSVSIKALAAQYKSTRRKKGSGSLW